jgi:predicted  nucleic acid-binding Zn-ribbon protein
LKEGLELLYTLQIEDDQIKDIEDTIQQIPKKIQKLEKERDSKKNIIENVKKKRDQNVKQREQLEKDIQLIKEKINKYKEQMNKSTTNKEYQGFIAEIKYEEERIASVEENIIKRMLEFDEIMDEIRERENDFNKIADEYNIKIKDLNENLKYNQSKLNQENNNKSDLRKKIPEKLLRVYDNLFKNKAGKAVSLVETEFCGICNIKIRPQLLSEIISNESIFICENCGRILFKKIEEAEAGS